MLEERRDPERPILIVEAAALARRARVDGDGVEAPRLQRRTIGLHQLGDVMDGKLDPVFEKLTSHFQAEGLKGETVAVG